MRDEQPNPHPIVLRSANEADLPAIVALENLSFPLAGERFDERRLRRVTGDPRFLVTVAEQNGQVLGWVAGFARTRGSVPWGRVYAIAVDPRARGQKLGRRLMENIIGALVQCGAARIFLEVRPDNHAAISLYRKLGFVSCRPLPNYYGKGVAALRMVRVMAASRAASP